MLNGIDGDKLKELLEANLITGIQYEAISSASEEDAMSIITTLIAEKVVMSEHASVSRLTAIIKKAVIHRAFDPLKPESEVSLTEIFDLWEKILSITEKNQEYKISIVLGESTYGMIREFMSPSSNPEYLNTVNPVISTVLVINKEEYRKEVLTWLKEIPGLELIYDPQEFIERAKESIVICDDIDSDKPEIIDLISGVLEKGIFLTALKFGTMNLSTISTIANAINRSPIPDGTGVLHLNGVLIPKPFDPIIKIGSECNRNPMSMPSGMEMSESDLLNMLKAHHG